MSARVHPDDVPIVAPFVPPESHLTRRMIHAADLEAAARRSAALRRRMRDKGNWLIAKSTRETPGGVTVELVFSQRS
jgi:hypothetical protein